MKIFGIDFGKESDEFGVVEITWDFDGTMRVKEAKTIKPKQISDITDDNREKWR